jgi:hypothetical protein
MTARIIPPRVPFLDERSGLISREWYLYFLALTGDVETMDGNALGFAPVSAPVDIEAATRDTFGVAPGAVPLDIATAAQDAMDIAPQVGDLLERVVALEAIVNDLRLGATVL